MANVKYSKIGRPSHEGLTLFKHYKSEYTKEWRKAKADLEYMQNQWETFIKTEEAKLDEFRKQKSEAIAFYKNVVIESKKKVTQINNSIRNKEYKNEKEEKIQ